MNSLPGFKCDYCWDSGPCLVLRGPRLRHPIKVLAIIECRPPWGNMWWVTGQVLAMEKSIFNLFSLNMTTLFLSGNIQDKPCHSHTKPSVQRCLPIWAEPSRRPSQMLVYWVWIFGFLGCHLNWPKLQVDLSWVRYGSKVGIIWILWIYLSG